MFVKITGFLKKVTWWYSWYEKGKVLIRMALFILLNVLRV
jgi:hypothetical protein